MAWMAGTSSLPATCMHSAEGQGHFDKPKCVLRFTCCASLGAITVINPTRSPMVACSGAGLGGAADAAAPGARLPE